MPRHLSGWMFSLMEVLALFCIFSCVEPLMEKKKKVYVNAVLFCRAHTDFKTLPFQYNIFDLYVFKKKKGYNLLL